MNSKAERERTKQIQDKCQHLINEMLKDDDNKYCVDCDAKGPRWASWNIGIFLCIRCAGLHRKLGVHISKVKSVNLDMWTPQQVVILQQMGNSRARAVYEANLPDNFRRPQNEVSLESFIRAKYEHKKYIAREWVAPAPPKVNWNKELEDAVEKVKKKKREATQSTIPSIRPVSTPPVISQSLPKPQPSSPKPARASSHLTDLLGLDTPVKGDANKTTSSDSDLFTSFFSATPEIAPNTTTPPVANGTNSAFRTEEEDSFFNQSSSTSHKQKTLTKDSILALYGNKGTYNNPPLNANVLGPSFNPVSANGAGNSFAMPNTSQPTLPQNDLLNSGIQFPNMAASTASNLAFSSNPFYSMAASGKADFPLQKTFANFPATNGSNGAELQQAQFVQQMESMNLNFTAPPSSHFSLNADSKSQQVNSASLIRRLTSDATINLPLSACPGTAQREKFLLHLQSAVPRKFFGTSASTLVTGNILAPTSSPSEASPSATSRSVSPYGGPLSPRSLQRYGKMSGINGVTIIREIYDSECPDETFERELDQALEAGFEAIIIEPARLGEETARWIHVGNCLHKCTIFFGLSSICLSITTFHSSIKLVIPLTMGSVFCAGLHMISWQSDPCCKYQIATSADLTRLASTSGIRSVFRDASSFEFTATQISASPTVLVRADHNSRKFVQTAIVSVALALAVIRLYT